MTTHTYTADFQIDLPWISDAYEIEIGYSITPARPARMPDMSGPGDPPESAEISIICAMWRPAGTKDTFFSIPDAEAEFLDIIPMSDKLYDTLLDHAAEEEL